MKILHINSNYLYTTLFDKMIQSLIVQGVENTVFMPVSGKIRFVIPDKDYVYHPICFNDKDRYLYNYKQTKIFKSLNKTLNVRPYNIVHAHTLFTDGHIAYKIKQTYGTPYVVAVRNTDVNTFLKYMIHLRKLGIKILKEAVKVIFLSESYRNTVIEKYVPANLKQEILGKTEIIPNGIDEFWLENKGNTRDFPERENLRLVYVGVINKNKNITTTMKAIEILQKKGFNVKFTVVGRIDDKSIYQQIMDKHYIKYMAPKSKEELLDIYRANDVFVMPSTTETFGLVYAEAMSQGLPVIYSKGQGFDGQFKEGQVGYSVTSNNPEDIAYAIEKILLNYFQISNKCLQLSSKFNWNEIANKYMCIYKKCERTDVLNI